MRDYLLSNRLVDKRELISSRSELNEQFVLRNHLVECGSFSANSKLWNLERNVRPISR